MSLLGKSRRYLYKIPLIQLIHSREFYSRSILLIGLKDVWNLENQILLLDLVAKNCQSLKASDFHQMAGRQESRSGQNEENGNHRSESD